MRITGRGHPAIRATHAKTLELAPDPDITERATCVLAVRSTAAPAEPLAGPVRITIGAGGHAFTLHAHANPQWDPHGPIVVRRSPLRLPGTLATHADAAAADLPPALVAALRDPDTTVTVDVTPLAAPGAVVLFAADPARPADPALRAELAAADVVVAEDAPARALTGRSDPVPQPVSARTLVVATADLPGASIDRAGVPVETVGLAPRLAVAAACPARTPVAFLGPDDDLAGPPAAYRVVLAVPADELPRLLERATGRRGTTVVTLAQAYTLPVAHRLDDGPPALPSRDLVHCCLYPAADGPDPRVRAAVLALLAEGVPTRAAARALVELTGWPRRRAYDAVLELAAGRAAPR